MGASRIPLECRYKGPYTVVRDRYVEVIEPEVRQDLDQLILSVDRTQELLGSQLIK